MKYDSSNEVKNEIALILKRTVADERQRLDDLTSLVRKAFEEGEDEGKKRERGRPKS